MLTTGFGTLGVMLPSEMPGAWMSMNVAIGKRSSRLPAPEWTAHSTPNPVTRVVSQPDQPANDQLPAGTLLGTARNHTQASKMAPKVARPQLDVAFWLKPLSSEQLYGPPSVESIEPAPG